MYYDAECPLNTIEFSAIIPQNRKTQADNHSTRSISGAFFNICIPTKSLLQLRQFVSNSPKPLTKERIPLDKFDCISPIDYRYWDPDVARFLSENAFTRYKLKVQLALVRTLARRGICPLTVVSEVEKACKEVTTAEVYEEEDRIRHDIRALVNCIQRRVSDEAKPFVHMTATSYDIVNTADAARYRDVMNEVVIPLLKTLLQTIITVTEREAKTLQVGRTHGQHAVPITFGFAMASYVSRLGHCIEHLHYFIEDLRGKFSGAVGASNATFLIFDDPEAFEAQVLAEFGLLPAEHSTQIVPGEAITRLLTEVAIIAGVLANLADDMRHLQRTEIAEVGEAKEKEQVGSSTMPHKRNPITFENAKGCWKIVMPRITTVFMDQISEHQRDLTNSAPSRTYGEMIAYLVSTVRKLTKTMKKLVVDRENLAKNLALQGDHILAEPFYIILAVLGHPDAHEKVRKLTLVAETEKRSLSEVAKGDPDLVSFFERMSETQRAIFEDPSRYVGIAAKKAATIAANWKRRLTL